MRPGMVHCNNCGMTVPETARCSERDAWQCSRVVMHPPLWWRVAAKLWRYGVAALCLPLPIWAAWALWGPK